MSSTRLAALIRLLHNIELDYPGSVEALDPIIKKLSYGHPLTEEDRDQINQYLDHCVVKDL